MVRVHALALAAEHVGALPRRVRVLAPAAVRADVGRGVPIGAEHDRGGSCLGRGDEGGEEQHRPGAHGHRRGGGRSGRDEEGGEG